MAPGTGTAVAVFEGAIVRQLKELLGKRIELLAHRPALVSVVALP